MVKPNREILTGGRKYAQKQAKKHLVEEVVFDKESRKEYLTGFHKRKLQRQKKAQEYNKEQDRLRRIQERKELRDERKKDLENQLNAFNKTMKDITVDEDEEEEQWNGFEEKEQEEEEEEKEESSQKQPLKGILHHKEVYQVDNEQLLSTSVIDEETTVTIESLDNPIIENIKQANLQAMAKINNVNLEQNDQILENSIKKAKNYAVLCGVTKPERKPKKKFRYLSKAERRDNTRKEKLKGKLRSKKFSDKK
ncbi:Ribosomal RNA-processing protein 17 [Spathaspora sp. JA1]|nr:Ribosomal RNA-processing protein 17 [Spathaspora sp. JA1]